ncbi:MAG: hypothetical protein UY35_C0002G0037 [Candidatus Saccharibacteria bacterium GW2011_GWC2_48_9]|nr:MAG: hypothetical protein UY35_C0002G0037 [Candidatus Saccharibacteria bacterium GW2011_GWC2_48_9]HCH34926.1 hypothetical protein [Candidatus Saccharibacteria bacterium]
MNVFYASSSRKDDTDPDFIVEYLREKYHVFHYDHVFNEPNDTYPFDKLVEEISNADIFIGEMSRSSQTLGFQLSFALNATKPCLYLYSKENKGQPKGLIGNIPSRNLRIKSYTSSNISTVIDEFMEYAHRQMQSTRTSFMSTIEIDNYLSERAKLEGISKGELIRQILHQSINDWK